MTVLESVHADHGASFLNRSGRRVVEDYGRPARAARAVRNAVGTIELGFAVVVATGRDRVAVVDDAVTNSVPGADPADAEGEGCYALVLDDEGRIDADLYAFNAGERLLLFGPPGKGAWLAETLESTAAGRNATVEVATDEFATFGLVGPDAAGKVAGTLHGARTPSSPLSFVRGDLDDVGVTVVAGEGLTGEREYLVVAGAGDAERVFETLLVRGDNAAPFGYRTWETLTLEAGTPLFPAELRGRSPATVGLESAVAGTGAGPAGTEGDETRDADRRLVALRPEVVPPAGAGVFSGDTGVGEITRAAESPTLGEPVALAVIHDAVADSGGNEKRNGATDLTVRVDGEAVAAEIVTRPLVDGSVRSGRLPTAE
ncbi:MAG: glycine cleavage T C-terminal barrel domain-containing protein [Halobacteriales archaeon]